MNKICNMCKKEKLASEFGFNRTKPDGRQGHCLKCGRERNKKWYFENTCHQKAKTKKQNAARKAKFKQRIKFILESYGCQLCPEKDSVALDFHHFETKEFGISEAVYSLLSFDRILAEVCKCVVLCSNCHRKVHAGKKFVDTTMKCTLGCAVLVSAVSL